MCRDPWMGSPSMVYAPSLHEWAATASPPTPIFSPGAPGYHNNKVYTRNCVMRFGRSEFSQAHKHTQDAAAVDDNLTVFPPKTDDNSDELIYSVPVHWKTRPECGTTLNMTFQPGG